VKRPLFILNHDGERHRRLGKDRPDWLKRDGTRTDTGRLGRHPLTGWNRPLAAADDLQQETFRIVIERLRHGGLADPAGLAPFLRGTARNLLIAERRKTARRRTWGDTGELAQVVASAPSPLQSVLVDEEAEMVRRLIGELPTDRDRQLLMRFYVGEEDKESICADLGLDSLHFNRVLFRARQRFKELLERSQQRQAPARPAERRDGISG